MDKNLLLLDSDIDDYNSNVEFNDYFDSEGEIDIKGYFLLPSKILFYTDRIAYIEALNEWRENTKIQKIELAKEIIKNYDNKGRLNELLVSIRSKRTIPFVGAGMSVPCGMPGWSKFLVKCAEEGGLDTDHVLLLLAEGKFEYCADLIISQLTEGWFNQKFRYNFSSDISELNGAVHLLPDLFSSGVITTNFDNVLEKIFEKTNKNFEQISIGPKNDFSNFLSKGIHTLFKIHGDLYSPAQRVLTKSEYDTAYGAEKLNFNSLIPKFIKHVSTSYCLLFLGCSLTSDRTMKVLKQIKENQILEGLTPPEHFAIISLPRTDAERISKEKELISHSIYPIWYPTDEHDYIDYVLSYIIENL